MFNSCDGSGAANERTTYKDEPEPGYQLGGIVRQGGKLTGIDIGSFPPGTEVTVDTCHSRYRFVIVVGSAGDALVEGGRYFPQETTARIEGSTLGGSLLKIGWIGLGLFLELSFRDKRIVTSRVRSITIGDPSSAPA
jgi:hypothetical protein